MSSSQGYYSLLCGMKTPATEWKLITHGETARLGASSDCLDFPCLVSPDADSPGFDDVTFVCSFSCQSSAACCEDQVDDVLPSAHHLLPMLLLLPTKCLVKPLVQNQKNSRLT